MERFPIRPFRSVSELPRPSYNPYQVPSPKSTPQPIEHGLPFVTSFRYFGETLDINAVHIIGGFAFLGHAQVVYSEMEINGSRFAWNVGVYVEEGIWRLAPENWKRFIY